MRDYYKLTFPITSGKRKTTQKLLLIGAITVDIGNFFVLIDCIFGSLYYLILLFALFCLSTVMRIVSLYCNYTYLYLFNSGKFIICKAYSLKTRTILELDAATKYEIMPVDNVNDRAPKLYNSSCELDKYVLSVGGSKYIIAIDSYMNALIKTHIGKETIDDIS